MTQGEGMTRDSLVSAFDQEQARRFEVAMRSFLERNKAEEINHEVVNYVLENQKRLQASIGAKNSAQKEISPLAVYGHAYHMIHSLPQTRSVMVMADADLGHYLPLLMGLVTVDGISDNRHDIYNISPTAEGLELFNKCFPREKLDPRIIQVAIEGSLLDAGPKKRAKNKGD